MALLGYTTNTISNDAGASTLLLLKGTRCEDPASTDTVAFKSARIIIKALIAKDLECFKMVNSTSATKLLL